MNEVRAEITVRESPQLPNGLPSIRKLRIILTSIFVAVCLLPATMFTIRQFEEARFILRDEAQILARLMKRESDARGGVFLPLPLVQTLAEDVLFKRASLELIFEGQAAMTIIDQPQVPPLVTVTQSLVNDQGDVKHLLLTRSIADRVPIMASVVIGALVIILFGLHILNRRVFRGWLRAEQAEQLSKQRFSDIATVSSDWFWELDSQLRVSLSTVGDVDALKAEHIIGKRVWEIAEIEPQETWQELKINLSEQIASTFVYTLKSGPETLWHEVRAAPYYDDEGRFEGYRAAGRDISEQRRSVQQIAQLQEVVIHAMASLAETRDNETGNHIIRTKNFVKLLAEQLRDHDRFRSVLNDEYIDLLYKSAPLHDIGKVGIPDHILLKPGKLTDDEFKIMKTHTTIGYESIIRAENALGIHIDFLQHAKDIALYHQEKWDGSGYPMGLGGDDIPLSARLMALADVYDALISERVYKPAFSHEAAVDIIRQGLGAHFDPDVTIAFLSIHEAFKEIAFEYRD